MKIIFCDTNIIFGLLKRICNHKPVNNSVLCNLSKNNTVYISDFVIEEAARSLQYKYDIVLQDEHIALFLEKSGCILMKSNILRVDTISFVNDFLDAQILQDAIDSEANFLITKNIKDFDIRGVYEQYAIKIVSEIPPILF